MSVDQHNWDVKRLNKLHKRIPNKTENGACLNRHDGGRTQQGKGYLKAHSCNHRWQAFKKAVQGRIYNWPAYQPIAGTRLVMVARTRSGTRQVTVPDGRTKGWDIKASGENFRTSCNKPYWHESHHIVPNNVLKTCIAKKAKGSKLQVKYIRMIRGGLLKEKYNLNHKINMINLPMDRRIARALKLPRHRLTAEHRSHATYSDHVKKELNAILAPVQEIVMDKHKTEVPDYTACKAAIERLSDTLYDKIRKAGELMASGKMDGDALDQIPESHLSGSAPVGKPKGSMGKIQKLS